MSEPGPSAPTASPAGPARGFDFPRWEQPAVWGILLVFLAIGLNNIRHFAFMGQDWTVHCSYADLLRAYPGDWFQVNTTSRPLVYWLANLCRRCAEADSASLPYADAHRAQVLTAFICVLANAGGLWFLHAASRPLLSSVPLRVAALAFIAFLPATIITAVVFAADALTLLPFAVACWALAGCTASSSPRAINAFAGIAGLALCAGEFAKFPFTLLPVAILFVTVLLKRSGRISSRQVLALIALACLVPAVVGGWLQRKAVRQLTHPSNAHAFNWHGTGDMTLRSMLWVKGPDLRIFDAPGYWDPSQDSDPLQPLVRNNNYSYPALLHLSLFTDVMDFANQGSLDNGTPRPEPQLTWSRWAVRGGVPFFILMLVAMFAFMGRTVAGIFRPAALPPAGLLVWGSLGLCWYLPIFLLMPFVVSVYLEGYWLPRLVIPAVWAFAFVLFSSLDRWLGPARKKAAGLILLAVLVQSAIQVRSLWY